MRLTGPSHWPASSQWKEQWRDGKRNQPGDEHERRSDLDEVGEAIVAGGYDEGDDRSRHRRDECGGGAHDDHHGQGLRLIAELVCQADRKFSATLEANLLAGDEVVAKAGTQVYGQVVKSGTVGRGIVVQHSDLVLGLTDINVEGTMYPIQTSSYSENSTGVILQRRSVVIPAGSLLEFQLTQPLTVKK